ncbi:Beta-ketoacyl-acyl-carrier-protein synthase I [Solidesulfovibrio carbinoliphilus subsp. oakridgensis]|uniref:3-oxoacyl-[acyl-carrier-protein] synthase 1 n=1 Tax=Solidesulfovibrio carbinoliphilus subsp. oakridgensis TaxID=694327 RepID=G7QB89_9BACT|nr:beta-ketoacyl-[acyl-carrier-protein] synthase family protein [Solidesulfovibrio carbinoliphilus]EHJ48831.1 Beta-ketoacyl-acyl-carrier-protein synthase I [Solidesulfovibrio carbinoliphilus subsp. oakridgensis]
MTRRVVITGVGIVSCLGIGAQAVGAALRQGKSGIVADPERVALGFRSPLTGRISGFDRQAYLTRKQRKTMPDCALQAYAAVEEAMGMARLSPEDVRESETGIVFGADSSCEPAIRAVDIVRASGETKAIGGSAVFGVMNSTVSMNLGCVLGARGACWTVSAACASGTLAIGQAAQLIALGQQRRILCGGAQEINWQAASSFDAIGAFSLDTADPVRASKPFDARRDGLVPSGGAAALVLEDRESAIRRNAPILGEVRGFGFASDGDKLAVPSGDGLARAIGLAMRQAGVHPEAIDYVCAHATSTPRGDAVETRVLLDVFGQARPPVSSLKSMTGHELWMAGASQAVGCVLMASQGFLAPNINFEKPDDLSAGLNIIRETIPHGPRLTLCDAAGFGGTNAALVLGFEG